ncbi:M20 family peptidase [Hydrocarboniphaga effusa]|uniref:M20 family peptidase n=1 Tax=Hydrocarboniphaga effusa TaxID=243629 RepID=UPI0035B10BFA
MLKKLLLALVLLSLVGVIGYASYRAVLLQSQSQDVQAAALMRVDAAAVADGLSQAIGVPTVSSTDPAKVDVGAFRYFHRFLQARFARTHQTLSVETFNDFGLLYTWKGSQPELPPVLLAAHYDVVPAATEGWTHPPFDGVIADGFVWGRGALDDKNSVMAIMEAVEALIGLGYQPKRTLLLAFGHDEEVGGERGAKAIAAKLAERGIKASYTLDEGGAVTRGVVAGVQRPVASLMAGEKGYLSVKLRLTGDGGHSSTPPRHTVIGRLAAAIAKLEDEPMPARLIEPVDALLGEIAPEMDWPTRIVVANRDWLSPVLFAALGGSRTTDALIRTTTAPTVFKAGEADNVLPTEGEAIVNFRLLPGDGIDAVLAHVREVIDDEGIVVEAMAGFGSEAPPASDVHAPQYKLIARSIREVFPEAIVASGIVLGATDNRHYASVREQGYNFSPMPYTNEDAGRIHGVDERIAIADYERMIQFYAQLLRNSLGDQ